MGHAPAGGLFYIGRGSIDMLPSRDASTRHQISALAGGLALALPILLMLPALPVAGAVTPNVTFIPDRISVNSSFLAIANGDLAAAYRIGWRVPGFGTVDFGSFPRQGNGFVCYFSHTDPEATCGPSPFQVATAGGVPYTMLVNAVGQTGATANATLSVPVGGIRLTPLVTVEGNTVFMEVFASGLPTEVTYAVYSQANLSLAQGARPLTRQPASGNWLGNATPPPGNYYFSFSALAGGDSGGGLARVSLGGAGGLCPAGPGSQEGLPLLADEVNEAGILINAGQTFQKAGYRITNLGNATIGNLTVSVPANFTFLAITLARASIAQNETALFSIRLDGIQQSVTINLQASVLSAGRVVGLIPVFIPVTVIGQGPAPVCPGAAFTLQPATWTGSFPVGAAATKSVTITNTQPSVLAGLESSVSSSFGEALSVTLPSSVPASGTATIQLSLNPAVPGRYEGTATITTGAGSQAILVSTEFFSNVSEDVESLRGEVGTFTQGLSPEQRSALSGPLGDLESSLSAAEAAAGSDPRGVERSLAEAQARLETLRDLAGYQPPGPSPGPGLDTGTILIVVAVLAIVGGAVLLIRKRRGRGAEEGLEEEFEEPEA